MTLGRDRPTGSHRTHLSFQIRDNNETGHRAGIYISNNIRSNFFNRFINSLGTGIIDFFWLVRTRLTDIRCVLETQY